MTRSDFELCRLLQLRGERPAVIQAETGLNRLEQRRIAFWATGALMLAACGIPTGPSETPILPSPATIQAEALATQCAGRPTHFPVLRYFIVPGNTFRAQGVETVGWGRTGKVTVAEPYRDAVPLLAHEILHARYGWKGGLNQEPHDPRFAACHLWPL